MLHLLGRKLRTFDFSFIPDRSELTQPCILMDPIKLKLGSTLVSFPAKITFEYMKQKDYLSFPDGTWKRNACIFKCVMTTNHITLHPLLVVELIFHILKNY